MMRFEVAGLPVATALIVAQLILAACERPSSENSQVQERSRERSSSTPEHQPVSPISDEPSVQSTAEESLRGELETWLIGDEPSPLIRPVDDLFFLEAKLINYEFVRVVEDTAVKPPAFRILVRAEFEGSRDETITRQILYHVWKDSGGAWKLLGKSDF